jgi:hypothetical protein
MPLFDPAKVHQIKDIPSAWLFGWFQKVAIPAPTDAQIRELSGKVAKSRQIRQLAEGLPDSFPMDTEAVLDKSLFSLYLTGLHDSRGKVLCKDGGLFAKAVSPNGKDLTFVGQHAAFRFIAGDGGGDLAKFIEHNASGSRLDLSEKCRELSLTIGTDIHNNYDDFGAFILVMEQKWFLYALFPNLKKPKMQDLVDLVQQWALVQQSAKSNATVEVSAAVANACKRRKSAPGVPRTAVAL